eukprot:365942-Chlamydomonas_euryale.AAC.45
MRGMGDSRRQGMNACAEARGAGSAQGFWKRAAPRAWPPRRPTDGSKGAVQQCASTARGLAGSTVRRAAARKDDGAGHHAPARCVQAGATCVREGCGTFESGHRRLHMAT